MRYILDIIFIVLMFGSAMLGFLSKTYGIPTHIADKLSKDFFYVTGISCVGVLLASAPVYQVIPIILAVLLFVEFIHLINNLDKHSRVGK